jgi:hypothetical protein
MLGFGEMELWLLGTAIVFTIVGNWMASNKSSKNTEIIIEATIDRLIQDGYVKARVTDKGEIELIKFNEE